ncbi:MAG: tryptophan synthase subunit alpha [Bacteroidales bacterium]|nr:tryptophan synthase subunit alpha [Bacteroidales bacterium]
MPKRLQQTLNADKALLAIYFTAGYPQLSSTEKIVQLFDKQAVDIIEIGIPFSDPLADGIVIQQSSTKALQNGMNTKLLFEQLKGARKQTDKPIVLMGYFNTVLQFGLDSFLENSKRCAIDALILPDLPPEVYEKNYKKSFEKYDIPLIFLVSPQSTDARIRYIDKLSKSFIYAVSSATTTGNTTAFTESHEAFFTRLKALQLKQPLMIGFGISNMKQVTQVQQFAKGAIIGSAFIRQLDERKDDLGVNDFFLKL